MFNFYAVFIQKQNIVFRKRFSLLLYVWKLKTELRALVLIKFYRSPRVDVKRLDLNYSTKEVLNTKLSKKQAYFFRWKYVEKKIRKKYD